MKPYYEDSAVTIYHGDCREILPQLEKVDLVLTDPPYGIAFDTDYTRFTTGFNIERKKHAPVCGDNEPFDPSFMLGFGRIIISWGANCYSNKLPRGSWLIWDKRFDNGKAFLADAEAAWMNKGHGIYIYKETQQGCIRNEPIQHPTQKPEGLMRWCINKSNGGGAVKTILDPFMGSGTTLRAAKDLGRKAIGIEIEEKYCEIAAQRMGQEVLAL